MTSVFAGTQLNPAQQDVVDHGLLSSGFNCVLQLPTGAGKTWLAERAIEDVLRMGGRAVYLTPLRALATELLSRWQSAFSGYEVGVFTGEFGQGREYPVPFSKAQLLIMTPERLDACTRRWRSHWSWLTEVDLLVVDELHLLGEPGRGPRLEGALSRVRRLNPFLHIVGLSATLGNPGELADWFDGVHFQNNWRPIPITWSVRTFKRAIDKPGLLVEEVKRCVGSGGQSLVFVQSRRRAEQLSSALRDAGFTAAFHHAGLQSSCRLETEDSFRNRELNVLVATGTLEMGLNLPARQVVLYDLQGFNGRDFVPLPVNTIWQRAGRAGRRGLDEHGEVVLLAPAWARDVKRYMDGKYESIDSQLATDHSLPEQILVEVASGLSRDRSQLKRALGLSFASHQRRLKKVDSVLKTMLEAEMLHEFESESRSSRQLKATRLGWIAVRQMLSPETVVLLATQLLGDEAEKLTMLDILLCCVESPDCNPLIPCDFEELESIGLMLTSEPSLLLSGSAEEVPKRFNTNGRKFLACLKTALVARMWTKTGDVELVAQEFCCYPFEVRRLVESLSRILVAGKAVVTPPKNREDPDIDADQEEVLPEEPTVIERVRALQAMVEHGIDEEAVTLTCVDGIGGVLARRIRKLGIESIEDLALAEPKDIAKVKGISAHRAAKLIDEAAELVKQRSAYSMCDFDAGVTPTLFHWPTGIDPYRLSRAMELSVKPKGNDGFIVSGGLEPHCVQFKAGGSGRCDCVDHEKGNECKHVLAVRLHEKDCEVQSLAARLTTPHAEGVGLDLARLWFEGR
jgi:helicase